MLAAKTEELRIGPGYRGSKSIELLMNKSTILTSSRSYLSSLKLWNQRMDSKQCLEETSLLDRCLSSLIELALPTPLNLRRRRWSTPAVPSFVASNPLSTTLSNSLESLQQGKYTWRHAQLCPFSAAKGIEEDVHPC